MLIPLDLLFVKGDGTEQKLPMSSASRFPLWVIDKDYAGRRKVDEVPGASNEGWVDPRRCHGVLRCGMMQLLRIAFLGATVHVSYLKNRSVGKDEISPKRK